MIVECKKRANGVTFVEFDNYKSFSDALQKLDAAFPDSGPHMNMIRGKNYFDQITLQNDQEIIYFNLIANELK